MLKRFGHLLLIAAILCATGTHWVVLQSVAWAAMLVENAERGDLQTAIAKTFDGKHFCTLCKAVSQGKQSERSSKALAGFQKLDFFNQGSIVSLNPSGRFQCPKEGDTFAQNHCDAPPVPPPRILPG